MDMNNKSMDTKNIEEKGKTKVIVCALTAVTAYSVYTSLTLMLWMAM